MEQEKAELIMVSYWYKYKDRVYSKHLTQNKDKLVKVWKDIQGNVIGKELSKQLDLASKKRN